MRVPTDQSEQKVVSDVQEFGWHVILVTGDEVVPEFAFTIGLFHNYGHPEVILFGLPQKVAHPVLNSIGTAVKNGRRFLAGQRADEFFDQHECEFVPFPTSAYHDYLGYARWFYSGDEFPALQCVWPDSHGTFPWEPESEQACRELQPMPGYAGEEGPR